MLTHHWKLLLTSGHITDSLFVMIGGNCNLKRGSSSFNRTHQFAHIDSVQCTNRITFLGPKAFTIVDQDTGQSFQYDNNKTHIFFYKALTYQMTKNVMKLGAMYYVSLQSELKKVHSHHLHRGLIRFSKSIISLKWFNLGIFFCTGKQKHYLQFLEIKKKILKLNHLREIIDLENRL